MRVQYVFFLASALLPAATVYGAVSLTIATEATRDAVLESHTAGVYQITVSGRRPSLSVTHPGEFDAARNRVLAFEYFCATGTRRVQVAFGVSEDKLETVDGEGLSASEGWSQFALDLGVASPRWSSDWKIFRIAFAAQNGQVFRIRNVELRSPSARELELSTRKEAQRAHDKELNASLSAYLRRTFPSNVTSVRVGPERITVEGDVGTQVGPLYLAEIPVYQHLTERKTFDEMLPLKPTQGKFQVEVARYRSLPDRKYDRLFSKWAVVRRKANGGLCELLSHARYPDEVAARWNLPDERPKSKKGLGGVGLNPTQLSDLDELGITSITVNVFFGQFLRTQPGPGRMPFEFDGKTYYAEESGIERLDRTMLAAANRGIIVSLIILIPKPGAERDPVLAKVLAHPEADPAGIYSMPNLTDAEGLEYYAAGLNFLAERYSRPDKKYGRVHNWIAHNEVDVGWVWTNAGEKSALTYMDLYHRSMRTIHYIARKYNPHARVFISLTHYWTETLEKHGYLPKELLDILLDFSRAEGDFEWAVAQHPYPQSLMEPRTWLDTKAEFRMDTPFITYKNIEVLDAWAKQPRTFFRGVAPRIIHLTEQGLNSRDYSPQQLEWQAAGMAYAWKKIERLDSIEAFQYHNWADNRGEGGLRIGLRKFPNEAGDPYGKKPIWYVYKALGTRDEERACEFAKKVIGLANWEELRQIALPASAAWIWSTPAEVAPANRWTYFRKEVQLDRIPSETVVHFGADSNARLWINGKLVLRKVTRYHEDRATTDRLDARPYLRAGRNVILVLHHNWGSITTFQRSANRHAGLYLDSSWLRTDPSWRWRIAPEFTAHDRQIVGVTGDHRIRYPQIVDGGKVLAGHPAAQGFDDSGWNSAYVVNGGPWPARPEDSGIPLQAEFEVPAAHVLAAGDLTLARPISTEHLTDAPLSIATSIRTAKCLPAPGRNARILEGRAGESKYVTFDFNRPVHGYPYIDLATATEGAVIDFGYAETPYRQRDGSRPVTPDGWLDPESVVGKGYADRYITRSGAQRFEVPDERTARWLTLHVHFLRPGRIELKEAGIVQSQYPVRLRGNFDAGDDRMTQVVRLALIHAQVTMVDGYVDTPGREDGTWIEDARVRAEAAARWFGDHELRRLVLRLHAESQNAGGGFHCFPPSNYPIGSCRYDWSVQWVAMLYDDWMWTGQTDLIRRYWDQLVLFWKSALAQVDERGLFRTAQVFGDIRVGLHPKGRQSSGIVSPFVIQRLRWAAAMAAAIGQSEQAEAWRDAADRMSAAFLRDHVVPADRAVPRHFDDVYDPDSPGGPRGFSQAAQAMAAVAGFPDKIALDYAFQAPDGAPPSGVVRWNNPTFLYRSLFALSENGFAERAVRHLKERYAPYLPGDPRNRVPLALQGPYGGPLPEYWVSREDLALHDGTPNPAQPVDDTGSHGWQAVPLLWLHDSLLGVRIVTPGGDRLSVAPQLAGFPYVSGTTMTPKGPVWVFWDGQRFEMELPAGATAEVRLPGRAPFERSSSGMSN